jgi:hypothetical protein
MRHLSSAAFVSLVAIVWGCSSKEEPPFVPVGGAGSGGTSTTGGGASVGGATTGGAGGSAGAAAGTGGTAGAAAGTGGASGATSGGSAGTAAGSGGASGSGGSAGGGGMAGLGMGGAGVGGGAGTGAGSGGISGASGSGTSGTGGSAGGPAIMPKAGMNFFVTSKGGPAGGNFGSLDAADAFCDQLATAVSADLGSKTWRAYLSTSTVNARDRIGAGPWRNQAGDIIANNLADLHEQEMGEALDDTWPPGDLGVALTETGAEVPNDVHDILTGTNADGTVNMMATCNNWTSDSEDDTAQVGHSNRMGGGRPPYFNATHTVGCAPSATNRVQGTVTSGGGRGSIYCFALEPSSGP